jgi:AraC-like DNA-binding protein
MSDPSPIRIVRHSSELARWESFFRPPDARLSAYIVGDYQGWIDSTARPSRRREVPSAIIPMILNLGPPFGVAMSCDHRGTFPRYDSFVAGLSDAYATTESDGISRCIQVNFTPIGAHLVLGVPMDELAHRTVELGDVLGATARQLIARLHDAPSWDACFAILDAFFVRRLATARMPPADVAWAWQQLTRSAGRVRIGALATELGRSQRHLIARFREYVGLPPKTVARILRFDHAVRMLVGAKLDDVRWTEVAYACGYYDQAHFNREFRELSGSTPSAFLGRRMPDGGGFLDH